MLVDRLRHRVRPDGDGDAGFTLIEVLVSLTLFVIIAVGAAVGIVNATNAGHTSQQRVDAANVAQSYIADAINKAALNLIAPDAGVARYANVGDGSTASQESFNVTRWVAFDGGATTCHPGGLFSVSVVVRQAQNNQILARSDAKVACPPA